MVLRDCSVVLHRLSEEQLNQFCNTDYVNEEVKCKTEELVNKTVAAAYDSTTHHKNSFKTRYGRNLSHLDWKAFEHYKLERQGFINRRKTAPVHFGSNIEFEDNSDNSPDMSQDEEFRNPSIEGRGKKRNKRGRKYERDSEWSPYTSKNSIQSKRNLRRHARKRVIESDTSSSTDEEDLLYNFYYDYDSYTAPTDVPSQLDDSMTSSTSSMSAAVEKSSFKNNSSDKGSSVSQNSSLNASGNANSVLNTSHTSDIVSDIIRDMNKLKKQTNSPPVDARQEECQRNIKPASQRGRKRFKFSPRAKMAVTESSVDLTVSNIIKEMVNAVCMEQRQLQLKDKQPLKKCKWCQSQFPASRSSEMYCPVCHDLGRGKLYSNKNAVKTPKSQKSPKQSYGSNKMGKKISNTMSRVMKILPKHERQRLMYTEKSSKLPNEKGYNHCKSFSTPKELSEPVEGNDIELGKEYDKTNVGQKKINLEKKKDTKYFSSADGIVVANVGNEKIQTISSNEMKQNVKRSIKSMDKTVITKKIKVSSSSATVGNVCSSEENKEYAGGPSGKSKVSLKKYDEGLFLMTFPESDDELNAGLEKNTSSPLGTIQNKNPLENSGKFNSSRATQISNTNLVSSNMKSFQTVSQNEQYRTYYLPPVPTVVVANYSASHKKSGDYCLSGIFYQNEFTQPVTSNSIQPIARSVCAVSNVSTLSTSAIPFQNPCISNLQRNSSITLTAVPLNGGQSITQPFTNNSSPVLNSFAVTAPNNTVTLLPVVSSVVSLSSKPSTMKETNPNNASALQVTSNNFTNSEQLGIKITHVSSENAYESKSKAIHSGSVSGNEKDVSINSLQSDNTQFPESKDGSTKFSNSNKTASENAIKTVLVSNVLVPNEKSNEMELSKHSNKTSNKSDKSENIGAQSTKFSDSSSKKGETIQNANSLKGIEQSPITKKHTDQSNNNLQQKQSSKSANNAENDAPVDSITSAIDLLGAISILAILDLEKNPQMALLARVQMAKNNLDKLLNEKSTTPDINEKILSHQHNLKVLDIAKKFLYHHGSFAKVSDFLLRKQQMIQIKKELLTEDEEEENQSSCRLSQKFESSNSLANEGEFSRAPTMPSPASVKMENLNSCRLSEQAVTVNHIEKIQSQIAAMNNSNIPNYDSSPSTGTVHHYPSDQMAALQPSVAAPTPVTPRNDCMGGESRETPSRGSGPRTPARPESATSQPEEQSLVQIKKELMEASGSPPSQCAYSQNTNLSQIASQMPFMPENQSNMGHLLSNNPVQHISVNSHPIIPNDHTNLPVQSRDIRTTTYNNTNPNYSNVLLNISARNQVSPGVSPVVNSNVEQNRQVLIGQSLYIQSGTGLPPKQAVPSVNNNQYVIRSPFSNSSNGGTVVVSNSQVGGQNVGALLTNVSNQQFYTSNQPPSQIYYPPPPSQINCMQNSMPIPAVTVAQNQVNIKYFTYF